jgi:hypothetical protein
VARSVHNLIGIVNELALFYCIFMLFHLLVVSIPISNIRFVFFANALHLLSLNY